MGPVVCSCQYRMTPIADGLVEAVGDGIQDRRWLGRLAGKILVMIVHVIDPYPVALAVAEDEMNEVKVGFDAGCIEAENIIRLWPSFFDPLLGSLCHIP